MPHGPMAGYADIISKEDLLKIMGDKYKDTIDMIMEGFGKRVCGEIFDDDMLMEALVGDSITTEGSFPVDLQKLWQTYRDFQTSFMGMIQIFIGSIKQSHAEMYVGETPRLHLRHHSDEEGCYDEVKGLYWKLENIYVKTEACRKIEAIIGHEVNRAFMVTYG